MSTPGAEWVEVVARASVYGLRYGQVAIVDRADADVRRYLRGGLIVETDTELDVEPVSGGEQ